MQVLATNDRIRLNPNEAIGIFPTMFDGDRSSTPSWQIVCCEHSPPAMSIDVHKDRDHGAHCSDYRKDGVTLQPKSA